MSSLHEQPSGVCTLISARGTPYAFLQSGDQPAPVLLLFASSAEETLLTDPYRHVGRRLNRLGWNVASLDLPCHGADCRPGEPGQLAGWAARIGQRENIAASFQQRVNGVVEHLVSTGLADPARIAAAGTSRGGFMAFHAAAGNPHIAAVAAFSPVTDVQALNEFAGQETNPLAHELALINIADTLAGRAAWIIIGNCDERVGTDRAIAFSRALVRASALRGLAPRVSLHVVATPGHTSDLGWHDQAAEWLTSEVKR